MAGEVIPLGVRLRQRREELGMSQAQAARELDVARTAYRLWEMEAARPAPDRWRVIAKWLGMSMTTLLLAGELLDEQKALDAEDAAFAAGLTSQGWDDQSAASEGDYFSQERAMIGDAATAGRISADDAAGLRRVLTRIQNATLSGSTHPWHPGRFVKRFPSTPTAPALARAALVATAVEIPKAAFDAAALLTSELVTNSFTHADSEWIEVDITLGVDVLRIAVSDQSAQSIRPRKPKETPGFGLALIGELASRWGVERDDSGKRIWVEFDLIAATREDAQRAPAS
jgi:transcriptional regulator with XRE-family HTH domain/anti-sigma regulatory factor (Ser/Thr protein kinase)